jgi:hypothetical protein
MWMRCENAVNPSFLMDVTAGVGSMSIMAAHTRSRADDERRIRSVTRWLLAGSVAATAAVGGLAAAHTHATSSSGVSSQPGSSDDSSSSDDSTLAPSSSAPQQSFAPPVAQSGGS